VILSVFFCRDSDEIFAPAISFSAVFVINLAIPLEDVNRLFNGNKEKFRLKNLNKNK